MGSKSTHQFPLIDELRDDDLIYGVRETSPGVYQDYAIPRSLLPPSTLSTQVTLTNAAMLALYDTPVQLVPAPDTDKIIVVKMLILELLNATVDYASGQLIVGGDVVDTNNYVLSAVIPIIAGRPSTGTPYFLGNTAFQGMYAGEALQITGYSGNPEDGDGDIRVTTFYSLIDG